jgi:hypothetical protein
MELGILGFLELTGIEYCERDAEGYCGCGGEGVWVHL